MLPNLKEKINYFRQHRFVRQAATLQAGNAIETFTQAIVGIFLARLLQPERFGVYSLAISLASLFSIFLATGVQDAAASLLGKSYIEKDRAEVFNIFRFLVWVAIFTGAVSIVGVLVAPTVASIFYHDPSIGFYAGIIIIAAIISNFFFSFSTIALQVSGRINAMMNLGVVDQLIRCLLSLLLVFLGFNVIGAVSGHLIGGVIVFFISIIVWEKIKKSSSILPSIGSLINWRGIKVKKYFGFSFWVALDRNIAMLYMILPVLITGLYVAASDVGFFKLAFGYVNLLMSLLGPISILLNVEFPKMQVEDGANLRRNFIKVSLYTMGLSTLLTTAGIVTAPFVFRVLYGVNYLPSIKYVFGLFIYGALYGIGIGLGAMWRAVNKVKTSIIINLIMLAIGIPSGIWLVKSYALWGAVVMVTLWFSISHLISFFYLAGELKGE